MGVSVVLCRRDTRLVTRPTWFGPITTTDLAARYKAAKAGTATKRRGYAIKALICAPQPGRRLAHRKAGPGRSRRFICYSQFRVRSRAISSLRSLTIAFAYREQLMADVITESGRLPLVVSMRTTAPACFSISDSRRIAAFKDDRHFSGMRNATTARTTAIAIAAPIEM